MLLTGHLPSDYSIPMGLVDLLPVIFYVLAACILIKEVYNVLKKQYVALICAGVSLTICAGFCKAIWKILLAANVCDFVPLNKMFMPVQGIGFTLLGVGLLSTLFLDRNKKNEGTKLSLSAFPLLAVLLTETVVEYDGTTIFIVLMVVGDVMITAALSYLAIRNKNWLPLGLFILAFVCAMMMGAMSPISRKMDVTTANWIEEGINTLGQLSLFLGLFFLNKKTGLFGYRK